MAPLPVRPGARAGMRRGGLKTTGGGNCRARAACEASPTDRSTSPGPGTSGTFGRYSRDDPNTGLGRLVSHKSVAIERCEANRTKTQSRTHYIAERAVARLATTESPWASAASMLHSARSPPMTPYIQSAHTFDGRRSEADLGSPGGGGGYRATQLCLSVGVHTSSPSAPGSGNSPVLAPLGQG